VFQCRIPDQQHRVDGGWLLQKRQIRATLDDLQRSQAIEVSEDLKQSDGGVAGPIRSDPFELLPWLSLEQKDRGDFAVAGDAMAIDDAVVRIEASLYLWNQTHIDLAASKSCRQLTRQSFDDLPPFVVAWELATEGCRVEKFDDANSNHTASTLIVEAGPGWREQLFAVAPDLRL